MLSRGVNVHALCMMLPSTTGIMEAKQNSVMWAKLVVGRDADYLNEGRRTSSLDESSLVVVLGLVTLLMGGAAT